MSELRNYKYPLHNCYKRDLLMTLLQSIWFFCNSMFQVFFKSKVLNNKPTNILFFILSFKDHLCLHKTGSLFIVFHINVMTCLQNVYKKSISQTDLPHVLRLKQIWFNCRSFFLFFFIFNVIKNLEKNLFWN